MAVAATLTPVNRTAGTSLAKAFGPVQAGEEWSVDVRVCNIGNAADVVDLVLRRTDGSNSAYRARSHDVPQGAAGTFDLEKGLRIPAGYELWDRSGAGNVSVSYTGAKRTAP